MTSRLPFSLFSFLLIIASFSFSGCSKGDGVLTQLRGGIGNGGGNGNDGGSGDAQGVVKKIGGLADGAAAGTFSTPSFRFSGITVGGPVHETKSNSMNFSVKGGLDAR